MLLLGASPVLCLWKGSCLCPESSYHVSKPTFSFPFKMDIRHGAMFRGPGESRGPIVSPLRQPESSSSLEQAWGPGFGGHASCPGWPPARFPGPSPSPSAASQDVLSFGSALPKVAIPRGTRAARRQLSFPSPPLPHSRFPVTATHLQPHPLPTLCSGATASRKPSMMLQS